MKTRFRHTNFKNMSDDVLIKRLRKLNSVDTKESERRRLQYGKELLKREQEHKHRAKVIDKYLTTADK